MKKVILTLLLGVTTLTAFAQVPSHVPTNGLVGYWPFNGNANDESGNGNNGTVNGAIPTIDRNGFANKAYSFDGINDYIKCNNAGPTGNPTISTSFWLMTNQTNYGHIIGYGTNGNQGNSFRITINQNCNSCIAFDTYGNQKAFTTNFNSSWDHYVVIYDGTVGANINSTKIYKNSILLTNNSFTASSTLTNIMSSLPITFGRFHGTVQTGFYQGGLDDIGIWNRVLSQQEITDLYTGCTNPTATINAAGVSTFCQGGSVVLNASTGSGYTYEWYKNGNIINGSITSDYTANQSGSYTVKVINGSCNATSSATAVTVNPNPTVSLSLANFTHIKASPVTLAGSPSGGTYSGAGVVGSTFSSTNAGLGKKTITYNYTTGAGCSGSATAITTVYDTTACSTFDTLFINIAVAGLIAPNNLGTLKIWPNPANDRITIDNGNYGILSGYSVKIETVLGQEVFKSAINQQQFSVDLTTWNGKGVYLVHVLDNQNNIIETKKIVLQ